MYPSLLSQTHKGLWYVSQHTVTDVRFTALVFFNLNLKFLLGTLVLKKTASSKDALR